VTAPDSADATIAVVGPGRMGTGIVQVFATAGHEVCLLDAKDRSVEEREAKFETVRSDIQSNLDLLAGVDRFDGDSDGVFDNVTFTADPEVALGGADWVFEALPEDPEIKRSFLSGTGDLPTDTVLATTTSSISIDTLASAAPDPERLLITHWLNPAFIVPLVEVARAEETDEAAVEATVDLLGSVGKEPVVCADSPGFIGSRIQAAAMNEAVSAWEDGVASAADIDRALRSGVGVRMAAMGLLEFIDLGGVDILYYVDEYLGEELGERFDAPDSVVEKMENDELGPTTGRGYYEYDDVDVGALKREKYELLLALTDAVEDYGSEQLGEGLPGE
jgi:3-hydroxybutyryl-CoA dehydrogenase